jgi:hydrophobe/amphiphile efflux-1 (HAE1) family protein
VSHNNAASRPDWFQRIIDFTLGWLFKLFNRTITAGTSAYAGIVRRSLRVSALVLLLYIGLLGLAYFGFRAVPTGFIPAQDQGYLIVNVQMPDAANIERSDAVIRRISDIALHTPGVRHTIALPGFSILNGVNQPNSGTMFCSLEPFEDRAAHPEQTANVITGKLMAQFSQVQEAVVLVFPPPPVRGIGSAGGFKMQVEDRSGLSTPRELQLNVDAVIAEARKDKRFAQLFTGFRANVPQLFAAIDRTRVKQQDVAITDVFQTLQIYLGSLYVNDFNYLGRTFKVVAQGDAKYRALAADVARLKTRNRAGKMVPLGAVVDLKDITGPDRIIRHNLYQAAEINGSTVPGVSSGEAIALMEKTARNVLPPGYTFEWTELAYQEKAAGNTALFIFPLCILLVWLVHSAEYESFAISTAIILIVPMCLLCGIGGVWMRHMDNNIFTQIGFVVLAGLSAKNAVLIVEFAKQQQEQGKDAATAAIEAARLRLRPILMTSFAFILGVVPLIVAGGAGSEMRQALGTVVFFGMLGVTVFGLFLTPVFYYVIQRLNGRNFLEKHA